MQTDLLNAATSNVYRLLMKVGGPYSPEGVTTRMLMIGVIKGYIAEDDKDGLVRYIQGRLGDARGSEAMSDLLGLIWEELDLHHEATWEEFEEKFLQKD